MKGKPILLEKLESESTFLTTKMQREERTIDYASVSARVLTRCRQSRDPTATSDFLKARSGQGAKQNSIGTERYGKIGFDSRPRTSKPRADL